MKTVFQNVATEKGPDSPERRTDLTPGSLLGAVGEFLRFYASPQELPEDGQDRVEALRWRPFPVRFTATVKTSEARGENWSLLL